MLLYTKLPDWSLWPAQQYSLLSGLISGCAPVLRIDQHGRTLMLYMYFSTGFFPQTWSKNSLFKDGECTQCKDFLKLARWHWIKGSLVNDFTCGRMVQNTWRQMKHFVPLLWPGSDQFKVESHSVACPQRDRCCCYFTCQSHTWQSSQRKKDRREWRTSIDEPAVTLVQ